MATTEMIVLVPPSPPPTPLPPEASLSTQERLRLAKRRRAAQLKRWAQRERERTHPDVVQMDGGGMATSSGKGRGIRFISNVMLLEAAARNDVEEGETIIFWSEGMSGVNGFSFSVRRLLELGVSPDSTNEDGLTALHQVRVSSVSDTFNMYALFILWTKS